MDQQKNEFHHFSYGQKLLLQQGEMCPYTLMLPRTEGWGELILFLLTQKWRTPMTGNARAGQTGVKSATAQRAEPEVSTVEEKPTWLLSLFCFSELPGQAGCCLRGPAQIPRFQRPDAGARNGLPFTLSYGFGPGPGLFADRASEHRGGVICQQRVACWGLRAVLLQLRCKFSLGD